MENIIIYNDCKYCGKRIEYTEKYCNKCILVKIKEENDGKMRRKRIMNSFFSIIIRTGQWILILSFIFLLFWGGPVLYRWMSERSHENVIRRAVESELSQLLGTEVPSLRTVLRPPHTYSVG